jgi:hypothetical protein
MILSIQYGESARISTCDLYNPDRDVYDTNKTAPISPFLFDDCFPGDITIAWRGSYPSTCSMREGEGECKYAIFHGRQRQRIHTGYARGSIWIRWEVNNLSGEQNPRPYFIISQQRNQY